MRAKTLLAAAAALALGAASAQAGFTVTVEVIPGTGVQNTGKTLILFKGQATGTSTHLQGVDGALTGLGSANLIVRRGRLDEDNVPDYDIFFINTSRSFTVADGEVDSDSDGVFEPVNPDVPSPTNILPSSILPNVPRLTSFIRPDPTRGGAAMEFYTQTTLEPANSRSSPTFQVTPQGQFVIRNTITPTVDPEVNFDPDPTQPNFYGQVKGIRVTGAWRNNDQGVNQAPLANVPVIFAGAVVNAGEGVILSFPDEVSGIGDEDSQIYKFGSGLTNGGVTGTNLGYSATVQGTSLVVAVPEPGSMMVLGLGALGLLARRRRA